MQFDPVDHQAPDEAGHFTGHRGDRNLAALAATDQPVELFRQASHRPICVHHHLLRLTFSTTTQCLARWPLIAVVPAGLHQQSPDMPVAPPKRNRKKRGARKGHKPHLRTLMPEESVTKRIEIAPKACTCGSFHLEITEDEPYRHQVVDIPPIEPEVIEYTQSGYRCLDCGELIYQPLPDEIKRRYFGPGLLALVGILTGSLNTSKRKALALINELFNVPMSLGGLSACEEQITQALERPYQELRTYMEQQPIAHADETGWPRGNRKKGWLWTLCCTTTAVFMVQAGRGQVAAQNLLGAFKGILHCDRWSGYNRFSGWRQLCWSHLKRDFKALSEVKGSMEVWLEPMARGTLVHWFVRGEPASSSRNVVRRYMSLLNERMFAFKDEAERRGSQT